MARRRRSNSLPQIKASLKPRVSPTLPPTSDPSYQICVELKETVEAWAAARDQEIASGRALSQPSSNVPLSRAASASPVNYLREEFRSPEPPIDVDSLVKAFMQVTNLLHEVLLGGREDVLFDFERDAVDGLLAVGNDLDVGRAKITEAARGASLHAKLTGIYERTSREWKEDPAERKQNENLLSEQRIALNDFIRTHQLATNAEELVATGPQIREAAAGPSRTAAKKLVDILDRSDAAIERDRSKISRLAIMRAAEPPAFPPDPEEADLSRLGTFSMAVYVAWADASRQATIDVSDRELLGSYIRWRVRSATKNDGEARAATPIPHGSRIGRGAASKARRGRAPSRTRLRRAPRS